jgi:predicted secreted protein with PEFG-CTERM motif
MAMTFTVSDSFAQEAQTINLTTNKNSYLPGDVVVLNGTVNGQPGQLVAIQVKDSTGNLILIRTIQTDQNGNFALQFKIPPTATSGNFDIMASARINGFIITQTKTMAATVPEFGQIAMPIFAISIMSVMVIFSLSCKFKNYHNC